MGEVGSQLEAGALFAGDYRVVRPLAEGGMGAVYVVEQLSTGKARALKLMRPEIAQDASSRQRFELEAKVGSRIESDHVVEIHSAGVDGATPYIVMELLDGEDLATRVKRTGALVPSHARALMEQVCHAVAAAHASGIVHRDLKPENIFLAKTKRAGADAQDNVKVLDFGIAKLVAESATRGQTSGMIGTPMWMAPEQTELGKITPAADVWALGLIFYYVLTGQPYWLAAADERATLTQLLKEMVMGPLPPASARARAQRVAGTLGPEIDAVFARSVVRDPSQRLQDARQFWNAVAAALPPPSARVVGGDAPASGIDQTVHDRPSWRGSHPELQLDRDSRPQARDSRPELPGRTVAVAPIGGGGTDLWSAPAPSRPVIPVFVPRIEPAPFAHEPGMRSSGSGVPRIYWAVPLSILMMVGVQQVVSRVARSRQEQAEQQRERERERDTVLGGVVMPAPPAIKASSIPGAAGTANCRICATAITASGPVPQDSVSAVFEQAYPSLDQQCVPKNGPRKKRAVAAVVSYSFVILEGRATKRSIDRSSANDGSDECLLDALGDLRFASSPEETRVSVTLAYDPAVQR